MQHSDLGSWRTSGANIAVTTWHQMMNKHKGLTRYVIDLALAARLHIAGVTGSSPVSPTIKINDIAESNTGATGANVPVAARFRYRLYSAAVSQ